MIFSPRPWQGGMIDFLVDNPRAALWSNMGSGKSVCTLLALEQLHMMGEEVYPALFLAPLRVVNSVWVTEVKKWDELKHLRVRGLVGSRGQRDFQLSQPAEIYCINYEGLDWLCERLGNNWPFKTIVCDESPKLKGFRLKQGGKRAGKLAKRAHHSGRIIQLTGTPAPNGLVDLWGQVWFLDKGERLGSTFTAFKERWFTQGYDGYSVQPTATAGEQIYDKLRDIVLTVDLTPHIDLAQPVVVNIPITLPKPVMALYKRFEKEFFHQLETGMIEARNAAGKTIKCLQIANGSTYLTGEENKAWEEVHTEKVEALKSIVEEANGSPILVAYTFRCDLERLLRAFPQGKLLDANPGTIVDWNEGKIPILFAHPKSCGHGLNLQDGGHHLVFFSVYWDLELHMQIIERIGPLRQSNSGHKRPVYVYYLTATGTLEEAVLERLDGKKDVQQTLLDAMIRQRGE